jgi:hypothetical protein
VTVPDYLYRLSLFANIKSHEAPDKRGHYHYSASPVFAGPDAAIEIEGDTVKGFINGEPSHPNGQLAQIINRYRDPVLNAARAIRSTEHERVILSGTWHHVDFDTSPRFEAYLIHVVSADGSVTTARYDAVIFDWEGEPGRGGWGFTTTTGGDPLDFVEDLHDLADHDVCKERANYRASSGLGSIGGMIWQSNDHRKVPVLFSPARGEATNVFEFEDVEEDEEETGEIIIGDGTLAAALQLMPERLKKDEGWFRGKTVDRTTHRPRKLKLQEVRDATDAIGYWIQTRADENEAFSEFKFFGGPVELWHEVLEKIDNAADDHFNGNMYVSDWIFEPRHGEPDRQIRLLAVGPVPTVSLSPL